MIRPTLSASSLKPGDKLPAMDQPMTTADLVAYGGATWDWNRLHFDLEYARSLNLPNVVVDGQAFGAVMAKHALAWLGPRAFMTRLSFKMRAMAFAGETLRAEGEVADVRHAADHAVVVLAQRLKVGDRVCAEATAEVRLPD